MKVRKRSGRLANLDISNIRTQTIPATAGLKNVSFEALELAANISFRDEMETSEIQTILRTTAKSKVDVDAPDWTYVAARLTLYDLYHKVKRTYKKVGKTTEIYSLISVRDYLSNPNIELSYDSSIFNLTKIQAAIKPERDELFTDIGIDTLINRYMLKYNGEIVELPQHLFMSVAMFLASKEQDPTHWAIKFYNLFSQLLYLPATPTLSNGRKIRGNCMSCAVGSTPDTIEGIFDTYYEQALGSKHGTGFGWDWTRVRANGGQIGNTKNAAGGLVPWLKIENDIAIAVDQLGEQIRPAA